MRVRARGISALAVAGVAVAAFPTWAAAADVVLDSDQPVLGMAWHEPSERLLVAHPGDAAVQLYDASGADRGAVTFAASPAAVTGIALHGDWVYIGDVGDPEASRDFVTVYRMMPADGRQSYRAWDFDYPDGAHDAAAMLVSGQGRIYVITRGDDPGIYRSPSLDPSRSDVNTFVRAADAPEGVTDAVFLDDGFTMAVRHAGGVDLIDAYTWETTAQSVYVGDLPEEAITTDGQGRLLLGSRSEIREEDVPDGVVTMTPTPEAIPSPTPSPSPSATTVVVDEVVEVEGPSRRGTALALLGAVAVSVLAGALVYFVRD